MCPIKSNTESRFGPTPCTRSFIVNVLRVSVRFVGHFRYEYDALWSDAERYAGFRNLFPPDGLSVTPTHFRGTDGLDRISGHRVSDATGPSVIFADKTNVRAPVRQLHRKPCVRTAGLRSLPFPSCSASRHSSITILLGSVVRSQGHVLLEGHQLQRHRGNWIHILFRRDGSHGMVPPDQRIGVGDVFAKSGSGVSGRAARLGHLDRQFHDYVSRLQTYISI